MNGDGLGRRGRLLTGLLAIGVLIPVVVSAQEIRVLFVVSRDAGGLDVQVEKLERAVAESRGPLVVAKGLSDAHVVVLLTEYRSTIGEKGEPKRRWVGQARLLEVPDGMTRSATPLPEFFGLLVVGAEGNEAERALESLERMLVKTLRPKAEAPDRETT
jgi:hypothetical protein